MLWGHSFHNINSIFAGNTLGWSRLIGKRSPGYLLLFCRESQDKLLKFRDVCLRKREWAVTRTGRLTPLRSNRYAAGKQLEMYWRLLNGLREVTYVCNCNKCIRLNHLLESATSRNNIHHDPVSIRYAVKGLLVPMKIDSVTHGFGQLKTNV